MSFVSRQKCTGAVYALGVSRSARAQAPGRARGSSHSARSTAPTHSPGSRRRAPSASARSCGQKTHGRAQSAASARAAAARAAAESSPGAPAASSARSRRPRPKSSAAATRPSAGQLAFAPQSSRRSRAATRRSAPTRTGSPTLSGRRAPGASGSTGAFTRRGSTPCTSCASHAAQRARRGCGASSAAAVCAAPADAAKRVSTLRLVCGWPLFCSSAWQVTLSSSRAQSCSVCGSALAVAAVRLTRGSRAMWQAPPGARLADGGGAPPKPEAMRGASGSSSAGAAEEDPAGAAGARRPRRIANAGRRRLTTHVSSRASVRGTQRERASVAAADAFTNSRTWPGRHSQRPPSSANSPSMQASQVAGKPCASSAGPACWSVLQTHAAPPPVRCAGHGVQASKLTPSLNVPGAQAPHTGAARPLAEMPARRVVPAGHAHVTDAFPARAKPAAHALQFSRAVAPACGESW